MLISKVIKGALLGSLIAVPTVVRAEVAVDPNCWRADEVSAARFEDFRLKVLVGALNCKNYLPGAATSYNNFLQAKKDFVLANMYVVRSHFAREAGASAGADNFANYETLVGNQYSAPIFDRAKCETVDAYARLAAGMSDTDLTRLVDTMSTEPLPSGCKPAARAVAPVMVVAIAPPPVPVPVASPQAVTALMPAVAIIPAPAKPMTDAQRIAASNAATRRLIASRGAGPGSAVAIPAAATSAIEATAVITPVAPVSFPAPVEVAAVVAPVVVPVVATAEPVQVQAAFVAKAVPLTSVALRADAPVRTGAPSLAVALALAEAAKALAAAALAMGQTGTN